VKDDAGTNVTVATPGAASRLDDNPMTVTTDFVKHIGTNAASYAEVSFDNITRTGKCVNAVQATVAQHGSNATGGIGASYVYESATQRTVGASATISGTGIAYKTAAIAPATGSWTGAKLNATTARVGYSSNATATNYPAWDGAQLEYDTLPNSASIYETEVLADSPAGYWRLGEANGATTATARSGTPNGTYTNSPTLGVGSLVGDTDTAASLDGVDDYINFGDNFDYSGTASFTTEFWINPTAATASYRRILSKEESGGRGWHYELDNNTAGTPNRVYFCREDASNVDDCASTGSTGLQAGTWYHIVSTYDGSNLRIYINGSLIATTPSTRSIENHTLPLRLGSGSSGADFLGGVVDEVAIYSSALSLARIQAHYNAGRL
jgi:hypothetical protein